MSFVTVKSLSHYDRTVFCPADKSISVRAVILAAYAQGESVIKNLSLCDDVYSAIDCVRRLGASVETVGSEARIVGARFSGCKLDCGNSATTARLLIGLLSGLNGVYELDGDESLRSRPMRRVIEPLAAMGANIRSDDGRLPVKVVGGALRGCDYTLPVPSAQVKSALLLAGLNASSAVTVGNCGATRNHTENMLAAMGASVRASDNEACVAPSVLHAADLTVPGDASSAAYPICLALALRGRCTVKNVGINETRTAYIALLRSVGADIEYKNVVTGAEPTADICVSGGASRPFVIDENLAPRLIDEIPVLCALACFINGKSVVRGAGELRFKESDRIKTTVQALRALGADIAETDDGIVVCGGKKLGFGTVDPHGDHRIAMSAAVAAATGGGARITGSECVSVSYPDFFKTGAVL